MWPMIISLTSAVFNGTSIFLNHLHPLLLIKSTVVLSIRAFLIRQAQFRRFLSTSGALTSSRYFRLMALAVTDIIFTLPLSIYEVVSNTGHGAVAPWRGWADAHFGFDRVNQYPAAVWRADPTRSIPLQLTRWITPLCALVFFAYFGFAEEARKNYSNAFRAIRDKLYRLRISPTLGSSSRYVYIYGSPHVDTRYWSFIPRQMFTLPSSAEKIRSDDILPAYTPPSPSTATCVGSEKGTQKQDDKYESRSFRTLSIPRFSPLNVPISPSIDEFPVTPPTVHYPFTPSTGHLSFTPDTAQFPYTPSTSSTEHGLLDVEHPQVFYHAVWV